MIIFNFAFSNKFIHKILYKLYEKSVKLSNLNDKKCCNSKLSSIFPSKHTNAYKNIIEKTVKKYENQIFYAKCVKY